MGSPGLLISSVSRKDHGMPTSHDARCELRERSADVHGRLGVPTSVVTQLVTHHVLSRSAAFGELGLPKAGSPAGGLPNGTFPTLAPASI